VNLLAATALSATILVVVGCGGRSQRASDLVLVSCGNVSVGIGWRVSATGNLECASARELISSFFEPRCLPAQRNLGTPCTVNGYRCGETALSGGAALVRCTRSTSFAVARSNH
jgi:hypothetical protein